MLTIFCEVDEKWYKVEELHGSWYYYTRENGLKGSCWTKSAELRFENPDGSVEIVW